MMFRRWLTSINFHKLLPINFHKLCICIFGLDVKYLLQMYQIHFTITLDKLREDSIIYSYKTVHFISLYYQPFLPTQHEIYLQHLLYVKIKLYYILKNQYILRKLYLFTQIIRGKNHYSCTDKETVIYIY